MNRERVALSSDANDRDVTWQAAVRRARFLRGEVESGRVPASHALGRAYLDEAARLEELFPPGPRTLAT